MISKTRTRTPSYHIDVQKPKQNVVFLNGNETIGVNRTWSSLKVSRRVMKKPSSVMKYPLSF